ncbi:MAG TPA: 16S rRNA (cytidine(1402)-2'-O)-methyltransferase [Ignavibacteriales bacterium]|nr:16S rRNA (cytidine(1402)-2'-O)-methyltransferase [Ignavibacteriales bacterium]HOL81886.1 16S rRNA (cytidine(1402)-2'-O)-methyltransferase [Ignavibacteriales bacterium]HOM65013.1 16S rRNA (cytidine(1402)-2'-O)-methyltransferase [Ignavibacteriales bacterium]HPD67255.1 16S rRNA (cytidine(1402)-2'-O)-methyltransferase [Ignavibacteriales bacterium]HPP33977.1 16S rRNA (cytidine(1402)-2'-O)-methyltransferase [Ignavibacteriales bacterium]
MAKLLIVSTPIGNLRDITLRALDVLQEADFIICEDTRVSSNLLKIYDIQKKLTTLNAHNEQNKMNSLIEKIKKVNKVALISDAGTPGISDPGSRLINLAIESGIEVHSIPGPSALLSAIVVSGFPTDSFIFDGFIPQKKGRKKLLEEYKNINRTIVFYESVYRIEKLLTELNEIMPERNIAICRELTKMYEEVIRGKVCDIHRNIKNINLRGEFVIVLAPSEWKSNDREN